MAENPEWRSKRQSKNLWIVIENGTAKSERWIHVNFQSIDKHIMHPTGDVSSVVRSSILIKYPRPGSIISELTSDSLPKFKNFLCWFKISKKNLSPPQDLCPARTNGTYRYIKLYLQICEQRKDFKN